jgi:hypothetical protein
MTRDEMTRDEMTGDEITRSRQPSNSLTMEENQKLN